MIRILFYLFIFFAPFTSFFAISAWLRLPVVIDQLLFLFIIVGLFLRGKLNSKFILKEDLLLVSFLVLVWLSFILGFKERRSFNHTLAYTNAIIFFFFLTKYVINILDITSLKIAKVVYYSFITSSIIILIDFMGKNYFNLSLRDVFTTSDGVISNMDYYIRNGFLRVGGVAEEPGHMALFYNIYFGISLYYLHKIHKKKLSLIIIFLLAHFALFSNAGVALTIVSIISIFIINKLKKGSITQNQIVWIISSFLVIIIVSFLIIFYDIGNVKEVLTDFFNKILFNESNKSYSSSGQRLKQWNRALQNFIKHPLFGNGPGFGVYQDKEGYLSVYLTIAADIGIIAFIFFIEFLGKIITKVMSLSITTRMFLLFSVITSFLHLFIIADFYHAPLWILITFIQLVYSEEKQIKE